MSLEFTGVRAPFHHQYFQMVDMLIHHFGRNKLNLNPCTKPCEPNTEVEEVSTNEEAKDMRTIKLIEGNDFGWKIPSKCVKKKNMSGDAIEILLHCKNNNARTAFDDNEEEEEEEIKEKGNEDEDNAKVDPEMDAKVKEKYDVDKMSLEDAEEIL